MTLILKVYKDNFLKIICIEITKCIMKIASVVNLIFIVNILLRHIFYINNNLIP